MDIHKPKAAHSVREFLIEIGTIICGVVIALGFEQAIEAWHWHQVVAEERAALVGEIGNLEGAITGRIELQPCFVTRLAEVAEIIRRHDAGAPLGMTGSMGRPVYALTPQPIWQLAVADQSIAHMSLAEKRRFTAAYNWISVFQVITGDERTAWRTLMALDHADKLTPEDWSVMRDAAEHAGESNAIIAASWPTWIAPFKAIAGEVPADSTRDVPPVKLFCTPVLTARMPPRG